MAASNHPLSLGSAARPLIGGKARCPERQGPAIPTAGSRAASPHPATPPRSGTGRSAHAGDGIAGTLHSTPTQGATKS